MILVRNSYPKTLIEYLNSRGFSMQSSESGIYVATQSPFFNIVILASKELDAENYTWLNALRGDLRQKEYRKEYALEEMKECRQEY